MNLSALNRIGGLSLVFAAAMIAMPAISSGQFQYEQGVEDELRRLGIEPAQVVDVNIYPYPDPQDQFGGAQAWIKLEQCPEGWLVMSLGRTGAATYAYTRDGCMLPGLD
ncbi:MAG: hypothetical protein AAFX92_18065 [Pseudomonadota bacterium]